ncbi:MAG: NUDIX domain-containing protein [Candidatus Woesearchaeota archaeon]
MGEKKVGAGFGIMLMRDRKVLLGKRHEDPEKADSALHGEGTWTLPGGKIEFGETFLQLAKREVMEETGIKLNSAKIIAAQNDKNEHAHFVTVGMISEDFLGEAKVMEPDEITQWQWFSLDKLPSPLFPPSAKLIKNYKNKVFCSD